MGYIDAEEDLKIGDVMELWIEESERADQSSSAQQKSSLESTGGHARPQQQQQPPCENQVVVQRMTMV